MEFSSGSREIRGRNVDLLAPSMEHHKGLCQALLGEPGGWFSANWNFNTPEQYLALIENALEASNTRGFVIYDKVSNRIAGITHFMKMDEKNLKLEIGATQVGRDFRRTHVNTETKLLLLTECFERLNCNRVEFRVDSLNFTSLAAVRRIGAIYEGELRNEFMLPDGRIRNYQVFSVIKQEWPSVRNHLEALCARIYQRGRSEDSVQTEFS